MIYLGIGILVFAAGAALMRWLDDRNVKMLNRLLDNTMRELNREQFGEVRRG